MAKQIDWAGAYTTLRDAGYSDKQIAGLAGVTRAVINAVRNGVYPFKHEPGFAGGTRILSAVALEKKVAG